MLNWFRDQKLSRKFLYSFSVLVLLLLIVGGLTYMGMGQLKSDIDHTANVRLRSYELLLQIDRDLQQATVAERSMLLTDRTDPKFEGFKNDHAENIQQAEDRWTQYKTILETDEEFSLAKDYEDKRESWVKASNNLVNRILSGDSTVRSELIFYSINQNSELFEEARNIIDKLTELNDNFYAVERENSQSIYNSILAQIFITILISLGLFIFVGVFITKTISTPILKAKEMMEKLSRGNLSFRLNIESKEEIGEMARAMDGMADSLKDKINLMQKISVGDLNVNIGKYAEDDEISPGLDKIVQVLKDLNGEIGILIENGKNGNLTIRGDESKFHGVYKEFITGINEILNAIVNPIKEGSSVLETMSTGDLTVRMNGDYKGDLLVIKQSINKVGDAIGKLIENVSHAIEATANSSSEISSSAEQLAAGAQEQSMQSQEVSSSVEEMTKTIVETAKNASNAAVSSREAKEQAVNGVKKVEDTKKGMDLIVNSTSGTGNIIKGLTNKTGQIGEITQVIDDIADQTNLLALNAAIEAARAGEQGRGFAVVADEVRKLAERTSKATKEIAETINAIQSDVVQANESVGGAIEAVNKGLSLTEEVSASFDKILQSIDEVTDEISLVATASEEQSVTSEEISKNIEGMNSAINESANGVQQIASTTDYLNKMTLNLRDLISQFKINSENQLGRGADSPRKLRK